MKVVIVEDELAASEQLTYLINNIDSSIEILTVLDSVKAAIDYFSNPSEAVLVFMDIHLSDGISFEIFEQVTINIPIIFTTAYDQYALKAFKVNSIDYLLKPINEEELSSSIKKFKTNAKIDTISYNNIQQLVQLMQSKNQVFRTTFLVHQRDELIPVKTEDIAYFYIENSIVKAVTLKNQTYIIDKKLEGIENELDPYNFHRANRQFILNRNAIQNIKFYFNGKLIINVNPPSKERITISKAKSSEIKTWINN
ncbi:LytTR family DNA-binding domain-containing protein [Flavivirga abyssicola]|uniref:LytR/AlgR family response regulator transcription factor n=1 Tax=Flavivirga abyssicola TaxID=3063533 RepID=UPI0026DF013E|nr:LytTR family DNA-binding domain-containing protein [Flavivirga sp. MEBiC07777]WVK12397.1 LytTR family DNA-binding domain-containing protein [Flavivirga sp. MEBiC07777]